MLGGKVEATFVLFPIMSLKKAHGLKYGAIGPASELQAGYPELAKILPAARRITVDGEQVSDPVLAVSSSNHSKFISEIEILAFLAAKEPQSRAEDELFGHRLMFTLHRKCDKDSICIDGHALAAAVETLSSIKLRPFPKAFYKRDLKRIADFEPFLDKELSGGLYRALVNCLTEESDSEARQEKGRIIVSLMLFNQASIHLPLNQPFSNTEIVLLAAAFEALLNLPSDRIAASFRQAVTTLTGARTAPLTKWCNEFYRYRSSLVHGDLAWEEELRNFGVKGKEGLRHSPIAIRVFVYCLQTKLFLMGLYPEYVRRSLDFDGLVASRGDVTRTSSET